MKYSASSRFAWIEEIGDEKLVKALKSLPKKYLEIITELIIDELTQEEIGKKRGVKRQAIQNKIAKIKKFLRNF